MFKRVLNKKSNIINLNFGPQHPAAHGVLRLLVSLKGEQIVNCDPHIGLLHRGSEKLIASKPFYLSLPYFDRMDYVSMMCQEHAYCLSVEKSIGFPNLPVSVLKTRLILDEITRVLNHLLAIACHALDVGSMSPIFWSFEERENIMEVYEYCSGARMHSAFYRPLFGNKILNQSSLNKISSFSKGLTSTLNEISSILLSNKVWRSRLVSLGVVSRSEVFNFGLTGVFSRASGIRSDFRTSRGGSYGYYKYTSLNSFFSNGGDSFSRFKIRLFEMLESSSIMIRESSFLNPNKNINLVSQFYKYMETTISNFKLWSGTSRVKKSFSESIIESPKGAFGVSTLFNDSPRPSRCKVRSPSYNNLLWLKKSAKNVLLADLITLIGTIDIVFGEVDR